MGGEMSDTTAARFQAEQIVAWGAFELPCAAADALDFFTPEGERDWVPGWNPQPIYPGRIVLERDTVFRTDDEDGPVVWTILDVDREHGQVEYAYVAADVRAARVHVAVSPVEPGRSRVHVTYVVTTLGERGRKYVQLFGEESFRAKMQQWRTWVTAYLKRRGDPTA
jgi:hypothetical protein